MWATRREVNGTRVFFTPIPDFFSLAACSRRLCRNSTLDLAMPCAFACNLTIMQSRVLITGLGFVTSIGNDKTEVLSSLQAQRHGIERVTWFDNPAVPVKVLGTLKAFDCPGQDYEDWTYPDRYSIARETLRSMSPGVLYAHCATLQAVEDAGLEAAAISDPRTGLLTASAGSPGIMCEYLRQMRAVEGRRTHPMAVVSSVAGSLHFNMCAFYKIKGAGCGFVSACSSSTHALLYAAEEIRHGRQDRMLVVGAEEILPESVLPFSGMRALSPSDDPDKASRPFDRNRDGFVATGGGVTMILESEATATARGAKVYGELAGWAQAGDGYHIAISHPEGDGLRRAMLLALESAGVEPHDVQYINAHATSTQIGDLAEGRAIQSVFGVNRSPVVSSTKGLTGHGLSVAGVMEAGFCALLFEAGFAPGNSGLETPDPALGDLRLPKENVELRSDCIVSNSSGFGGGNVCLVLRRV